MLRVVLNPEEFDENFSSKVTKWQLLDYASGNDINLFPFASLPPTKLSYVIRMIIEGENPFGLYEDIFKMPLKKFEDMMVGMNKNKLGMKYVKNNIQISKSKISTYQYNLTKYARQNDLLGDKIKNKMSVTTLDFAEYSTLDRAYLLPIMKMTFVQPSAMKNLKMEDIETATNVYANQYENNLLISHIKCKPTEIKII